MKKRWVTSTEMGLHNEATAMLGEDARTNVPALFGWMVSQHLPQSRAERRGPEDRRRAAREQRWAEIAAGKRQPMHVSDYSDYDGYEGRLAA